MWTSLFSLFFALIGLGFLIFIHELGHYWMARRVGMRVEAFGIGFGRAIMSFERKGVKWNIGWIPFGGYVKIAGMEQEKKKDSSKKEIELHEVEDGFFGRSPWDRIKVSFAGPVVNILFAFLVFCGLWWAGGREKNFSDATKKIGWMDPSSELYKLGLRPGDEIEFFDTQSVKSFKDHMQAAMTKGPEVLVKGRHYNPVKQAFEPFSYEIRAYQHPYLESGLMTFGALAPASLLVYPNGSDPLLLKNSPLEASGIQPGDRIVSLDTERVYSFQQLSHLLNDGRILVTVRRGNELLQRRIPVLHIEELKLDSAVREELSDWQWETPFKAEKLQKLFFIPYNLNSEGVVEGRIALGDTDAEAALFPTKPDSEKETTLQKGDVIVAVNGKSVHTIAELFAALQTKKVTLVVQRNWQPARLISAENADSFYDTLTQEKDLSAIENAIRSEQPITESGKFVQLTPVAPVTRRELQMSLQKKSAASAVDEEKKLIQAIDNPEKRTLALKQLETRENQLILGLPATDMHVSYNPNPVAQFGEITDEMMNTLGAIAGGYLNPKWLSGPVGIVQVFQSQWTVGFKEAMFWLAIISLNLGLLNLLPLPVLDGGYIALSFFEIVTGVRIKAKTLEKIIVPFAILLIGFFIFITFNDVSRLITNLWPLR